VGCIFSSGGRIVPRRSSDLEWEITPNSLEIYHRGFLSPDLPFGMIFSGLEAISLEAEFAWFLQPERAHLAREGSTYSLGSWISSVFSLGDS
jgi:hypothetical protein